MSFILSRQDGSVQFSRRRGGGYVGQISRDFLLIFSRGAIVSNSGMDRDAQPLSMTQVDKSQAAETIESNESDPLFMTHTFLLSKRIRGGGQGERRRMNRGKTNESEFLVVGEACDTNFRSTSDIKRESF